MHPLTPRPDGEGGAEIGDRLWGEGFVSRIFPGFQELLISIGFNSESSRANFFSSWFPEILKTGGFRYGGTDTARLNGNTGAAG